MTINLFYTQLQQALVAWAENINDIRAILLVGSQARQVKPADEYSDLDLLLFTKECDAQVSEGYLAWMRDYAPIWMILEDHHDESYSWLILYQGGIKVDFAITPITALQPLIDEQRLWDDQQRGYSILLDKDGLAAQLPAPQPLTPPLFTPPTPDEFVKRVEGYFYGAVYVAKQLKRGNLWKAKWADQIQQRMLLEMLEWHAHLTRNAPVDTYYRGDFMQDWVGDSTWQTLHGVFAHFDANDSWQALLTSIRLFTRLTEESAAQVGYDVPHRMMREVTAYIMELAPA